MSLNKISPRRSVLYMPGANARALEKARELAVDSLIFDLEDAVSPDAKAQARAQIIAAVNAGGYGKREIIVRVNGLDTAWGKDDIAAIAALPIHGVLLPKVGSVQEIAEAANLLDQHGGQALPIWIMAETPKGILNIAEIASGHPRLSCIVMGTSDLAKDMRVRHTPDRVGLIVPLSLCILAARAAGVDIVDGVHLLLDDEAGFRQACVQGRDMGFDGKTLIHPKQIAAANEVFAPNPDEVAYAEKVITAWQQAQAEGKGVAVVGGKLVENLHVEEAKRLLALAAAIAERG